MLKSLLSLSLLGFSSLSAENVQQGSTVSVKDADGTTVQVKPDGSKIINKPDGSKTIKKPDGSTIKIEKGQD